jgi:hypothetical protein
MDAPEPDVNAFKEYVWTEYNIPESNIQAKDSTTLIVKLPEDLVPYMLGDIGEITYRLGTGGIIDKYREREFCKEISSYIYPQLRYFFGTPEFVYTFSVEGENTSKSFSTLEEFLSVYNIKLIVYADVAYPTVAARSITEWLHKAGLKIDVEIQEK